MPRNLIICCDGTGNEIKENQSNVLKYYRLLKKDKTQIAYYDPGVGTISDSGAWSAFKNKAKGVFGLLTGYGLDDNILGAYQFLIRHYQKGDHIYLLGFSRGAYTVRVLAGFINLVGLLHKEQEHLSSYALTAYKQANNKDDFGIAFRVNEVLDTHRPTIKFMGCWDTVGSVIIPRPDRWYLPALEDLPFVRENPSVQVFRQAIAIDERRRMFRIARWTEPQLFKATPFLSDEKAEAQDIKQVWFAGVHSDIGGGYKETESGLAKIPLKWMVDEGRKNGLMFRETMVKRLVLGRNPKNSTRNYSPADPLAKLHISMNHAWRLLEYIPKHKAHQDWIKRKSKMGFYLPFCEPRTIGNEANIDKSVRVRIDKLPDYDPENVD